MMLRRAYRNIRRRLLKEEIVNGRGTGLLNLIDVGSIGELPDPWRLNAYRIRHLLKFEPRDSAAESPHITTLDVALWEENTRRDFYLFNSGSGSSLFRQNIDYVREHFEELSQRGPRHLAESWFQRSTITGTESFHCRRLDDVLAELPAREYHFMKIDAQGAEYPILKGAVNLLRGSCIGLHLELFTIPLYEGIALLPEVETYLNGFGFELVKKFPPHGTFHSQHNCLFLKQGAPAKLITALRQIYRLD